MASPTVPMGDTAGTAPEIVGIPGQSPHVLMGVDKATTNAAVRPRRVIASDVPLSLKPRSG